jgi:hypothetical protein
MNFWTFVDKNSFGLFVLVVIALTGGFSACGACSIRNGENGCQLHIGAPTDAGAP